MEVAYLTEIAVQTLTSARGLAMIVGCIDNNRQRDVLVVGRKYEVYAERDDCHILSS